MSAFRTKLENGWTAQQSLLTLGLDPDPARFPAPLQQVADPLYAFCRAMVDACAPYVCAFKPQIAYFSSAHGEAQLEALCHHIKVHYPDHTLILDAKRGDIGATAAHYAKEAFERYQADAVTVNPYMGLDSIEPFLQWSEKGVFILCRTSNPGGSDLQFLTLENGQPLYLYLAELIARHWDKQQQCGLVVGATFPDEIRAVRAVVGDMPLLIPGIGAQGGDIARTVAAGADQQQQGMLINSSRAILYASQGEDWLQAAQQVAQSTRDAINAAFVTRP